MNDQTCTLTLAGVTKRFGDFTAVDELSLCVRAGRIFGLIGPNGAGKTTTLRMIVNIVAPDSGRIELFGESLSAAMQDRIGYLPEERGLYQRMRVGEQLRFFGALKTARGRAAEASIDSWLKKLGLIDWKNRQAGELSKGMQQKVQFIVAVLHDPNLLILDEPFAGLDPVNLELLMETVRELKDAGKTIILSTHLMEQAESLCDDICLLNRSRKVLDGSLREVKRGFARNMVALRVEGGDGVLDDPGLVAGVETHGDGVKALLAEGASAHDLLRRLLDAGARISKFEIVEPSLHDIFIAKVSERDV